METLPKNVLFDMALKLTLDDLVKFCRLSKRFDEVICRSDDFWRRKLNQDFGLQTQEKNTKKIYEDIIKNKDYCNKIFLEGKINPNDYVINSFDEIFDANDYLVFLFLRAKILGSEDTFPDYFQNIFNQYIKKINHKYGNKITSSENFTPQEIIIFIDILKRNKGDSFQKVVIKRMINNDISLHIKWKDLCENSLIY
jgi:hypothetical protein